MDLCLYMYYDGSPPVINELDLFVYPLVSRIIYHHCESLSEFSWTLFNVASPTNIQMRSVRRPGTLVAPGVWHPKGNSPSMGVCWVWDDGEDAEARQACVAVSVGQNVGPR